MTKVPDSLFLPQIPFSLLISFLQSWGHKICPCTWSVSPFEYDPCLCSQLCIFAWSPQKEKFLGNPFKSASAPKRNFSFPLVVWSWYSPIRFVLSCHFVLFPLLGISTSFIIQTERMACCLSRKFFFKGNIQLSFHDRRFCQIIWQIWEEQKNSSKIAPGGNWNQDLRIMRPMLYQLSLVTFSYQPKSSWPL